MSNLGIYEEECACSGSNTGSTSDIIVRSKPGISTGNVIKELQENGKKVYELDDKAMVAPVVVLTNNAPAENEVGQTISTVTFSGSITQGSNPIASRSITPDPGGLNLNAPFTFQKTAVTRDTPGVEQSHNLQATDSEGNASNASSGVLFKHAFYAGPSDLSVLTQSQIKALTKALYNSIVDGYGGEKTYQVSTSPAVPRYLFWAGPVGTPAIAAAKLDGFNLPLVDLTPVLITNIHKPSLTILYWVKRTAYKLNPGTYKIEIS